MENNYSEEQINKDFKQTMIAWDEYRRKKAIKSMFNYKSFSPEFKNDLVWYKKWFYWAKCLICLLLKRCNGSYLNSSWCIICFNEMPSFGEYSGYEWDACWVETGIFKNWKVCICSDSFY